MSGRLTPEYSERSPVARPRPPERGWIRTGLYMMTLPMTITVGMMLAPAFWMFSARRRP
jgi:hypothetical protein